MFTVGRILAGLYAKRAGVDLMVQGGIVAASLGTVLLIWNPSQTANVAAVGLISLAIAPIFPALMSGTTKRVGVQHAGNTIGMQMAATGLGTVIIPACWESWPVSFRWKLFPFAWWRSSWDCSDCTD